MKNKEVVEVYINGRLYKTIKRTKDFDASFDKVFNEIYDYLYERGYKKFCDRDDSTVYANIKEYKIAVVQSKYFTGYYDSKGNKLYDQDTILYDKIKGVLRGTYPFEGYYIDHTYPAPQGFAYGLTIRHRFITQRDFNDVTKVKDCLEFETSNWNTSNKIKLSEL